MIGLSCAWRLVEAGHVVRLVADQEPADTTSAVAAAIWYPYLAEPRERVGAWGATTYDALRDVARDQPASGVRMLAGVELFDSVQPDPWWSSAVPDLRRLLARELPTSLADGWTFTAPVVDMPVYLAWLRTRLSARGVDLALRRVHELADELAHCDVVINCTGLGARALLNDHDLVPVRGQVIVLTNPGLASWWLNDRAPAELTYVVPRLETVVVGGTAERGEDHVVPDPATASAILSRALRLVPALSEAKVVGHRVGLRPARSEIRLERDETSAGPVVHCYGHGGAGVTLSWGCAGEVVALVAG